MPLTTSCSLIYMRSRLPSDDIKTLHVELTSNLETIEARMDHQWDMMMSQFQGQAAQMTSQFHELSIQLTVTPQPLTPSNLQLPSGPTIVEGSDEASDNSSWLYRVDLWFILLSPRNPTTLALASATSLSLPQSLLQLYQLLLLLLHHSTPSQCLLSLAHLLAYTYYSLWRRHWQLWPPAHPRVSL
jgi:hypothetical protein